MEPHLGLGVDLAPSRPGALRLRSPVLASGVTGYGREFMRVSDAGLIGGLVTRVTTLDRKPGSRPPRLAATPAGVVMGRAPTPGLSSVLREYSPVWAEWPLPVILAVAGQSPGEYARIGGQVDGEPGVAGLEIDLSGPPEPGKPWAGWDAAEAWQAVHAVRESCSLPLLARLPWSGPALVEVARAAVLAGADALTLVSPLPGLSVDVARRGLTVAGTWSGPAVLPLVLSCLRQVSEAMPETPLVAAGGVWTGDDAVACLMAGASAVQVDSAALADPRAPMQVLAALLEYCREKDITEIKQILGTAR